MKHFSHDYFSPWCTHRSMMQSITRGKCPLLPCCSPPHTQISFTPSPSLPAAVLKHTLRAQHTDRFPRMLSLARTLWSGSALRCSLLSLPQRLILPSLRMLRSQGESQFLLKTKAIQLFNSNPQCRNKLIAKPKVALSQHAAEYRSG